MIWAIASTALFAVYKVLERYHVLAGIGALFAFSVLVMALTILAEVTKAGAGNTALRDCDAAPRKPLQFGLGTVLWAVLWIAVAMGFGYATHPYPLLILIGIVLGALYVTALGYLGIGSGWRGLFGLSKKP